MNIGPQFFMTIVAAALSAVLIDVNAYIASREKDAKAKFDWGIFVFRLFQGLIVGFLAATTGQIAQP